MMFYLLVVVFVPFFGVMGLIAALCASIAANHLFSLPWYVSHLAFYHAEFLAGILAYLAMPYMRRFGALVPLAVGAIGLYYFLNCWGGAIVFPNPVVFPDRRFRNVEVAGKSRFKSVLDAWRCFLFDLPDPPSVFRIGEGDHDRVL